MDCIKELKEIIERSSNIVFFGGAGVSTESNIPDFRTAGGIFSQKTNTMCSPEVILSHNFFINNPEEFYEFYKKQMIYKNAKPNPAHITLAELERRGKLKAVVTQNIDGLHQMAGSKNVVELHGSVHRNYCMDCGKNFGLDYILDSECVVPKCDACGGIVRPDVVLYQEQLDDNNISRAVSSIASADVLIVGGTSLVVYPAAGLVEYFNGDKLILINKSSTAYDNKADLIINDSIGKVLGAAVN